MVFFSLLSNDVIYFFIQFYAETRKKKPWDAATSPQRRSQGKFHHRSRKGAHPCLPLWLAHEPLRHEGSVGAPSRSESPSRQLGHHAEGGPARDQIKMPKRASEEFGRQQDATRKYEVAEQVQNLIGLYANTRKIKKREGKGRVTPGLRVHAPRLAQGRHQDRRLPPRTEQSDLIRWWYVGEKTLVMNNNTNATIKK